MMINPFELARMQLFPWQLALLLWFAGAFPGLAQPVITAQPRSLAVPSGSNAVFSVTATGTPPLKYQWYRETEQILRATNASLALTNLGILTLGSYTVLVRNDEGETHSQRAWLKLGRWTEFVYFGDSECQRPESNGPTWGDYLPDLLCLPANARKIYFTDGASEADVRSQISSYLATSKPSARTLVAVWKGGMIGDLLIRGYPPERAVSNRIANLKLLADANAESFLVPKQCGLSLWPAVQQMPSSRNLSAYDRLLDDALIEFASARGVQVIRPDMESFEQLIAVAPGVYGFTNLTANAKSIACDANKCYHWDGFHVTTVANRLWSQFMYEAMVPPMVLALRSQGTGPFGGDGELTWSGGSPPFRLELSYDLANGLWWETEINDGTNTIIPLNMERQFFRLVQLGQ
jgi:hypothetical protein